MRIVLIRGKLREGVFRSSKGVAEGIYMVFLDDSYVVFGLKGRFREGVCGVGGWEVEWDSILLGYEYFGFGFCLVFGGGGRDLL